jgi:hypothetical protein
MRKVHEILIGRDEYKSPSGIVHLSRHQETREAREGFLFTQRLATDEIKISTPASSVACDIPL